ncbi:unnamed protein product [Boreogadus saida]
MVWVLRVNPEPVDPVPTCPACMSQGVEGSGYRGRSGHGPGAETKGLGVQWAAGRDACDPQKGALGSRIRQHGGDAAQQCGAAAVQQRGCRGAFYRYRGAFYRYRGCLQPLQELSLAGPGSVQSRFMGFPLPVQGTVCVGVFPDVEPDALRQ